LYNSKIIVADKKHSSYPARQLKKADFNKCKTCGTKWIDRINSCVICGKEGCEKCMPSDNMCLECRAKERIPINVPTGFIEVLLQEFVILMREHDCTDKDIKESLRNRAKYYDMKNVNSIVALAFKRK